MFQQRRRVRELPEGRTGQSQGGECGEKAAKGDERSRWPGAYREAEEANGEQPGVRGRAGGEQRHAAAEEAEDP